MEAALLKAAIAVLFVAGGVILHLWRQSNPEARREVRRAVVKVAEHEKDIEFLKRHCPLGHDVEIGIIKTRLGGIEEKTDEIPKLREELRASTTATSGQFDAILRKLNGG